MNISTIIAILLIISAFFLMPIFAGENFCWMLGVVDNGPGTIGCFYSAP